MQDRNYLVILLGILVPVLIFFPLFLMSAMGAGDIKLLAVTGAFFTIRENLKCIVLAVMFAGVIALIKVLLNRNLRERFMYLIAYLRNMVCYAAAGSFYDVSYIDKQDPNQVQKSGIKFSFPVLLGAIVVMGGRL